MVADQAGNNVQAVFVPVGGFMAFAEFGTSIPSKEEIHAPELTLPEAFRKVGLLKVDGGFEWTAEQDGDNLEFWQEGYDSPSGIVNASVVVAMAQFDNIVRELVYGQAPDGNGVLDVELASNSNRYVLWTEEVDKWRRIRRRVAPNVGVGTNKEDKSERGAVNAQTTTFNVSRSAAIGNAHYREALILPADFEDPDEDPIGG